jgi:hypothetical protein
LPNCLSSVKQYNIALVILVKIIKQRSEKNLVDKLITELSIIVFEQNKLQSHQIKLQLFIFAVNNRTKLHYR